MNGEANGNGADVRALAALLAWQAEMGADEAVLDRPADFTGSRAQQRPATQLDDAQGPIKAPPPKSAPGLPEGIAAHATPGSAERAPGPAQGAASMPALPLADAGSAGISPQDCASIEEIYHALDSMRDFPLRKTATNTVYVDGNPEAPVLLIGEAPGRDEDLQGRPFVGRSGRLLDLMLEAIGLSRTAEDPARAVLISNVVFWRPPGNRKPEEAEVAFCMPWLIRTIEIVRPRIIVCLGATPTQRLTGRTQGILKLRGGWLQCEVGAVRAPLLPMLHPAYLLRQPLQKRLAWRDMLTLKLKLIELGLLPEDAGW